MKRVDQLPDNGTVVGANLLPLEQSGVLTKVTVAEILALVPASTATVGGPDRAVQFNNNGALGGNTFFKYDSSSNILFGNSNINNGASFSVIEGFYTTCAGPSCHSEGIGTYAGVGYSHAEGTQCATHALYAHAEGIGTIANGQGSHSEGDHATADAAGSHAEGYNTRSAGANSHAEGIYTLAQGGYSHASGWGTTSFGIASFTAGFGTYAAGDYQVAIGTYNINEAPYLFKIGNGVYGAPSDIFKVSTTQIIAYVPTYSNNSDAIAAGMVVGGLYRSSDSLHIVY